MCIEVKYFYSYLFGHSFDLITALWGKATSFFTNFGKNTQLWHSLFEYTKFCATTVASYDRIFHGAQPPELV